MEAKQCAVLNPHLASAWEKLGRKLPRKEKLVKLDSSPDGPPLGRGGKHKKALCFLLLTNCLQYAGRALAYRL